MDQNEIANEIARRKQRAKDLKLRELLWKLYGSFFQYYSHTLEKDPDTIHPEIRESLSIERGSHRFTFGGTKYELICKEGKVERDSYGSRSWEDEIETTPLTLSLSVNGDRVFEFEMRKTVQYTRDAPLFHEYMGEVTAFIEGPWIEVLPNMVEALTQHRKAAWDRQNAPRGEQKLKEDMKHFGL